MLFTVILNVLCLVFCVLAAGTTALKRVVGQAVETELEESAGFREDYTATLRRFDDRLAALEEINGLLGLSGSIEWEEYARLRARLHANCSHGDPVERSFVRDQQEAAG